MKMPITSHVCRREHPEPTTSPGAEIGDVGYPELSTSNSDQESHRKIPEPLDMSLALEHDVIPQKKRLQFNVCGPRTAPGRHASASWHPVFCSWIQGRGLRPCPE